MSKSNSYKNLNTASVTDDFGNLEGELVAAVYTNDIKKATKALEHGANVHANDDEALRLAAAYNHFEMVKLLIENGANIHARNDEALLAAACKCHLGMVKLLVEKGANIYARLDEAIHLSLEYGNTKMAEQLKNIADEKNILFNEKTMHGNLAEGELSPT